MGHQKPRIRDGERLSGRNHSFLPYLLFLIVLFFFYPFVSPILKQNQPALEKDRYKIRQAFIAAPGNSLIVADYGQVSCFNPLSACRCSLLFSGVSFYISLFLQLELRILAHLANCKSMLAAFKAGGDFHSRTAMNMYPHIRAAVDQKEVLLEWDPQPGEDKPPVPLLKVSMTSLSLLVAYNLDLVIREVSFYFKVWYQ